MCHHKRTLPGYTGWSGTSLFAVDIIENLTWIRLLVWQYFVCLWLFRGAYLDRPVGLAICCLRLPRLGWEGVGGGS